MHCHYDHCARYYGLASGWGAFGAASNEEKHLTMQLFLTLLNKLSSKVSWGLIRCLQFWVNPVEKNFLAGMPQSVEKGGARGLRQCFPSLFWAV